MTVDLNKWAQSLASYGGERLERHQQGDPGCLPEDHCVMHHLDEPTPDEPDETVRVCGECGHVFLTELDLQAVDKRAREMAWHSALKVDPSQEHVDPEVRPVADIHSCPFCTHDF